MKVTSLIENTKSNDSLQREHGLSLLIETAGRTILFDTGQSDKFIQNAEDLGIDLNAVDFAVISHGHYDHGGGIRAFLEVNDHAPVYINRRAFEKHYHQSRDVGLDDTLSSERFILVEEEMELAPGITLRTNNRDNLKYPLREEGFFVKRDGEVFPEDFHHEQYLEIIEDGKRVLFSGCSHKGILNIANWYDPDILIGGFHLMDVEMDAKGEHYLDQITEELGAYPCKFYTCHCTGREQYIYLKDRMSDLNYLSTGDSILI